MIHGIVAAGQMARRRGAGGAPIDLTDPWEEITRVSVVSGKLTVSGLDFSGIAIIKAFLDDVTITTDDSSVAFRLHVAGSEASTGYEHVVGIVNSAGTGDSLNSVSATEVPLTSSTATRLLGNDSTEGLGAEITIYSPGSTSLYKRCTITGVYGQSGGLPSRIRGDAQLVNTSAVTGITVFGSSNLTGGTLILLGLE